MKEAFLAAKASKFAKLPEVLYASRNGGLSAASQHRDAEISQHILEAYERSVSPDIFNEAGAA